MENYDDILMQEPQQAARGGFDKEAWAAQKKAQREQAYATVDKTAEQIATDGAAFQSYLDVQSRFDRYSVTNALLIAAQRPDATRLGSYDTWKRQGAYVKKGAQGITILEPGDEYRREDGSIGTSYNPKLVFDVSQTNLRRTLQPQPDSRTLLTALTKASPVGIQVVEALPTGGPALFDPLRRTIFVKKGMTAQDIVICVSMEIAHAEFARTGDTDTYNRVDNGFHAYCVSYMVCKKYGIDTQGYNVQKLPEYFSKLEPQEVRGELSQMRDVYHDITARMGRTLERAEGKTRPQGQAR